MNSPKLLQLSGFGPAALLQHRGIKVSHDLPLVGRGLQDHLVVSYQFNANVPTLNNILGNKLGQYKAGLKYLLTRRGPLAVPVNQVGGFVKSNEKITAPDIQLYCNPMSYSLSSTGAAVPDKMPGYQLSAQPCRATSTGVIEITSNDIHEAPNIMPCSLSTAEDKAAVISAGRTLQRYANANCLRELTTEAHTPDLLNLDDAALLEDFQNRASTIYHASCTCRMGRTPHDSVLDARLRVHGVNGLRVADASSFPNITSGNTNAPTMMLAMKAADLILEDAK